MCVINMIIMLADQVGTICFIVVFDVFEVFCR